jgi:hypothetical protein
LKIVLAVKSGSGAEYLIVNPIIDLRRGADESLTRSGKKQATATKLGIYST